MELTYDPTILRIFNRLYRTREKGFGLVFFDFERTAELTGFTMMISSPSPPVYKQLFYQKSRSDFQAWHHFFWKHLVDALRNHFFFLCSFLRRDLKCSQNINTSLFLVTETTLWRIFEFFFFSFYLVLCRYNRFIWVEMPKKKNCTL